MSHIIWVLRWPDKYAKDLFVFQSIKFTIFNKNSETYFYFIWLESSCGVFFFINVSLFNFFFKSLWGHLHSMSYKMFTLFLMGVLQKRTGRYETSINNNASKRLSFSLCTSNYIVIHCNLICVYVKFLMLWSNWL